MAYPVATNSILEATINQTLYGQTMLSIFHYKLTSSGVLDGGVVLDDFNLVWGRDEDGAMMRGFSNAQSENVVYNSVVLQWIAPNRYARRIYVSDITGGVVVGAAISPQTSAAITKQSDLPRPHGVGTLHLGGLLASDATSGLWGTGARAKLATLSGYMSTEYTTAGGSVLTPVIFNRVVPSASEKIITAVGQPQVRTMRRRVVGRGI